MALQDVYNDATTALQKVLTEANTELSAKDAQIATIQAALDAAVKTIADLKNNPVTPPTPPGTDTRPVVTRLADLKDNVICRISGTVSLGGCFGIPFKNVLIEGTGPQAIITSKAATPHDLFYVTGSNVTIRGLTFDNINRPDSSPAGVVNGQIVEQSGVGIAMQWASDVLIENCTFLNVRDAINIGPSKTRNVTIRNCTAPNATVDRYSITKGVHAYMVFYNGDIDGLVIENCTVANSGEHNIRGSGDNVIVRKCNLTNKCGTTTLGIQRGINILVEDCEFHAGDFAIGNASNVTVKNVKSLNNIVKFYNINGLTLISNTYVPPQPDQKSPQIQNCQNVKGA